MSHDFLDRSLPRTSVPNWEALGNTPIRLQYSPIETRDA